MDRMSGTEISKKDAGASFWRMKWAKVFRMGLDTEQDV